MNGKPDVTWSRMRAIMGNNARAGLFFFSESTMAFFDSAIEAGPYGKLNEDQFFVTSERGPDKRLLFTLRHYDHRTHDVKTAEGHEFQSFSKLSDAITAAKNAADARRGYHLPA